MLYTIKDLEELFSSLNKNCRVFKDDGSLTKQGRIGYEIAKKAMYVLGMSSGLMGEEYYKHVIDKVDEMLKDNIIDLTPFIGFAGKRKNISEETKNKIYEKYKTGKLSQIKLARVYGISQQRVSTIIREEIKKEIEKNKNK